MACAATVLRRRHVLAAACGAASLQALPAWAQARAGLRILLSGTSEQGTAVAQALVDRFAGSVVLSMPDTTQARLRAAAPPAVYIAIGAQALESAAGLALDAPLLSLLVSRQGFGRVAASEGRRAAAMTAIYAEPSPLQQMQVIRAVFARPVTVGTLVSRAAGDIEPALQAAAAREGLALKAVAYAPDAGLLRNLARVADAGALLIFPDATVYTPQSLREVLETTYRRRQPVIGFSAALVAAGTLASAHTTAADLVAQAVPVVADLVAGRLPPAQYPRYWQMAVNDSVARSLDIVIDPPARRIGERP